MKKGLVSILSGLAGAAIGAAGTGRVMGKRAVENQEMSDKHLALFLMMNQWVKVKQEGKNLALYFEKLGYREIAIYGMSYVGETLVDELKGSGITIKYGIDQRAENIYEEFDMVSPEDRLEEVDAIVVTSIKFFDEIEERLREKVDCPIISLEDILYEV
ncbi:MAG: hypothetical protein J1D87_02445 [Lachnospiraceae bacterium]|nr:hypothetical protein [Lachnospiraceae bacterium]